MHDQLTRYHTGFLDLKEEATALTADLNPDAFTRRPDPDTWSVAELLDHMNTAGWLLLQSLEITVQDAQESGPFGTPPFEYGFISRWFVRSMKPSSDWTFSAPEAFEPRAPETIYPNEALEEFRALQDQFANCVEAADGLDLRRIRVSSPAVPLLRISLGAWFEATIAHQERHLTQARQRLPSIS